MEALEFIKCPKKDSFNRLHLGMHYASYSTWAGFYIPDFPRQFNGNDDIEENVVAPFVKARCRTKKDVQGLLTLSLKDAVGDNVKVVEGGVNIALCSFFDDDDDFLSLIKKIVEKFEERIDFRPELLIDACDTIENLFEKASYLLESGVFKSLSLSGAEAFSKKDLCQFKSIFDKAASLGIKKKAVAGEFCESKSIVDLAKTLCLDEIQNARSAADDEKTIAFLKKNDISLSVCPGSNVMLGAAKSIKDIALRRLFDEGVRFSIASDRLLLTGKSISEQCAELVNSSVFSASEIKEILQRSLDNSSDKD